MGVDTPADVAPVGGDGALPRTAGITVLIVDPQQALAEALAEALQQQPGVTHTHALPWPPGDASALATLAVDAAVVGTDGVDWDYATFLKTLRQHLPQAVIVAMAVDPDPTKVAAAVRAGAVSWVSKQAGVRELGDVVVAAARGEARMPPSLLFRVLPRLVESRAVEDRHSLLDRLTVRERQILDDMARGKSRRDIAARMQVSVNTVRTHVQHILGKLEVHSTLEAVTLALQSQPGDVPQD